MMCTCCAAPVVVGMRKSQSSIGAAIAYWMSNTALNPAVLVFMAFVLPLKFVVIRVLLGLVLVFGVSHLLNRLAPEKSVEMEKSSLRPGNKDRRNAFYSSVVEATEGSDLSHRSGLYNHGLHLGGSSGLAVSRD